MNTSKQRLGAVIDESPWQRSDPNVKPNFDRKKQAAPGQ